MRYRIVADVAGEIYLTSKVDIEHEDLFYEFIPDKHGMLRQIAISIEVDASRFQQSIKPGKGKVKVEINVKGDKRIHDRLTRKLQSLESQIAVGTNGALSKIYWERTTHEYIPENAKENDNVYIRSTRISKIPPFPRLETKLSKDRLQKLLGRLDVLSDMDLAFAFWREGVNEMRAYRFIPAFYNFYYVIEGFCAKGKSSQKEVLKEFKRCPELSTSVEKALKLVLRSEFHQENLAKLFASVNCSMDYAGTLEFLIKMRGSLHHVSFSSSREQGTPFTEEEYASLAVFSNLVSRFFLDRLGRIILRKQTR